MENKKTTHGGARAGAGRPSLGDNLPNRKAYKQIQIRVTPERKAQIEKSAKSAGLSVSQYLLKDK